MPGTLSPDLQATIRKCLQTDRRKRMTLRQALKDDPWLTNHGELPCPFASVPKTAYDEVVGEEKEEEHVCRADRERRARRQFMKDLERDKNRESTVKRTVIYHPVNPSTYFTPRPANQNNNGTQHNRNQQHYPNIELLRSELLQSIRTRSKRLGMRTADRWDLRSPVQSLTLRFKKKSASVTNSQDSIHTSSASLTPTTTSNTNNAPPSPTSSPSPSPNNPEKSRFSEVMHRWTNKDQVYYFHIGKSSLSHPPSLSSSLSTSTSSLSSTAADHAAATPRPTRQEQQQQQQQHQSQPSEHQQLSTARRHERDVMQLLKQTCQLMGITYVQDSPRRLLCVLTLRDGPKGAESSNVGSGGNGSAGGPPSSSKMRRRTSRNSSQTTAISSNNDDPTLVLGTSGAGESTHQRLRRLSLPLFSQLTSSMTTSFFGRTKQRHSVDEQRKKTNGSPEEQQQQQQKEQQRNKKKDGLAVFAIDVEFHSKSNQQHSHESVHMLVALRFSKQQGSTTVFKMAGGWVAGVMGLSHP